MSGYMDDVEPIAVPASSSGSGGGGGAWARSGSTSSLGKRTRTDSPGAASSLRGGTGSAAGTPGPSGSSGGAAAPARPRTPEPDEDIDMRDADTQMWLVRVPRFLKETWSSVSEPDAKLGFVRVYDQDERGHQRMELHLDKSAVEAKGSGGRFSSIPQQYELHMARDADEQPRQTQNIFAFREWEEKRDGGSVKDLDEDSDDETGEHSERKSRRRTALAGGVINEVFARPSIVARPTGAVAASSNGSVGITPEYRALLRQRRIDAAKPKSSVVMLNPKNTAENNMLAAGVTGHAKAKRETFIATKQKPSKSTEKFARMPKNELLDLLMTSFDRYPYWSLKALRQETQQPEAYLKDVLSTIGDLHKRGPYTGNWSLKSEFRDAPRAKEAAAPPAQASGSAQPAAATPAKDDEGADDDDDDDDDDGEDFDEVI